MIGDMRRAPFFVLGAGALLVILGTIGLASTHRPSVPTAVASSSAPSSLDKHAVVVATPSATAAQASASGSVPQSATATRASATPPPVATISIPRIGIHNAPIYDRGTNNKGVMLIAPGYAVTHYAFSAPFGGGNAVIYGHDDIQGNIFGRLYDLGPGDLIQVTTAGQTQTYRVSGPQIVAPTSVGVLAPTADVRLTIITCWPFNVDTKRWIVTAFKS
jgi:sortase A